MSVGSFMIVAAGTGINALHAVRQNKDPFPIMFGGLAFGIACSTIDDASNAKVGKAMALVFLLASFLTHGVDFINTIESAMSSPKPVTVPGTATATPGGNGSAAPSHPSAGSGAGGSSSGSF